jgi:hypothetical protein
MTVLYKIRSLGSVGFFEYSNPVRMLFISLRRIDNCFDDFRADVFIGPITKKLSTLDQWNDISSKTMNRSEILSLPSI